MGQGGKGVSNIYTNLVNLRNPIFSNFWILITERCNFKQAFEGESEIVNRLVKYSS